MMDIVLKKPLRNLACVYQLQGRFDEADRLFGEAFNIASKNLMDQDCPEALAAAVYQTDCVLESGDIERAVRHAGGRVEV